MLVDLLITIVLFVVAASLSALVFTMAAVLLLWVFCAILSGTASLIAAVFHLFLDSPNPAAPQELAATRKRKRKQPARPFIRAMPDGMRAVQALLIEQQQAQAQAQKPNIL